MKLRSLAASFDEFRDLEFVGGLNVVLADRAETAGLTDSRNGLGKTTMVALVDFCLGAQPGNHIRQMAGRAWSFSLAITTRSGAQIVVTRAVDDASSIVLDGDLERTSLADRDSTSDAPLSHLVIGNSAWTTWLREEVFPTALVGSEIKPPSFRSLIRRFIRYRLDAFLSPFNSMANPGALQTQSENAFLLNLDWRLASEWSALGTRKKQILLMDDPDESVEEQIGSLQSQLIRAQRQVESIRGDIEGFSVLPEYREVEQQVDRWAAEIKALANENIVDRRVIGTYESRQREEFSSSSVDVERLFDEAGVALGDAVIRSLDEAAAFHLAVVSNRVAYLEAELRRLQERLAARELRQAQLSEEQAQALQLLRSGGALEDFAVMQQRLGTAQAEASDIQSRIGLLTDLRARKTQLKADELNLKSRTDADLDERLDRRAQIISRFGEILEGMYGEQADLRVVLGKTGLQFSTKLPRSGSSGVDKIAIFAYDIAVIEDLCTQSRGPGFLIHDSTIFDGVDERQVAEALVVAMKSAEEYGYQYIVTLNSDVAPIDELEGLGVAAAFEQSVVLTLSDADDTGGLLGVRLSPTPEEDRDPEGMTEATEDV